MSIEMERTNEDSTALLDASNSTEMAALNRETLILNVGGVQFETYRSTLLQLHHGPLADTGFLQEHFRPDKNDYFFDRDPDAFKVVINYLRTGIVQIPAHIDSPSVQNELKFWGLTSVFEQSNSNELWQGNSTTGNELTVERGRQGNTHIIWNILSNPSTSLLAKLYAGLSYFFMFLSVFILVAETTHLFHVHSTSDVNSTYEQLTATTRSVVPDNHYAVGIVSNVCCLFFTIEYILRVVFAPNKLRFILSFLAVIDILAVLPQYALFIIRVSGVSTADALKIFRLLRLFRVFCILRLLRIFKHFKILTRTDIIVRTLKTSVGELVLLFGLTAIGVLLWGTLAYDLEKDNETYDGMRNIPDACWWSVITMTTVGYGDIIMITIAGKIVASFCALSGLLVFGLLVTVLASNMRTCLKTI